MFTIDHISQIHASVKLGSNFPQYVQDLKALGMAYYDIFACDGHSEYYSTSRERLESPKKYPTIGIASKGDAHALRRTISLHQLGSINFLTFCHEAASAGVKYWRIDVTHLRCIFYDMAGHEILIEPIPHPQPTSILAQSFKSPLFKPMAHQTR